MSFIDRLVLWLHIAFAVFTIGPVSVAIMSTPRYIRARNLTVVRYLYRTTRIFALISLGVAIFGVILAQQQKVLAKPWLTAALTLFVVAVVLLAIIIRDQRKSINALEVAEAADGAAGTAGGAATAAAAAGATAGPAGTAAAGPAGARTTGGSEPGAAEVQDSSPEALDDAHAAGQPEPARAGAGRQVATVERGRITTTGAVVSVIWLVILVLMVWH